MNQSVHLTSESFFKAGDTIATAANSRLDLMLVPQVLLALGPDTEIAVDHLHLKRDGNESIRPMTARHAAITLRRGTLVVTLGQAQTEPGLRIKTPIGTVTSGPAQTFEVRVEGDQLSIFCVRGAAIFRSQSSPAHVEVGAGSFATFPPPDAVPQRAALAGAAAQAKVPALLRVEKRLLRLQAEKLLAYRPW